MAFAAREERVVDLVKQVVGERESPWDREEAVAVGRGLMAWKDARAPAGGGEEERILLLSWYKHGWTLPCCLPSAACTHEVKLRCVRSVRMCGLR